MNQIRTKSFQLATYEKGNPNSNKLALVLPGKLDSKDYAHMRSHVDHLATLGFFALSIDPPGTWESPGDISLYTVKNYIKAADEVIEYFGNKSTILIGHSLGGAIATIAGTRNKYVIAYINIMFAFSENKHAKEKNKLWQEKGFTISLRALPPGIGPKTKQFVLPFKFLDKDLLYNLSRDIKESTKPKLFICATEDKHASPSNIKNTYNKLTDPKMLYEINGAGHDYRRSPDKIQEVNVVIEKFLSTFI